MIGAQFHRSTLAIAIIIHVLGTLMVSGLLLLSITALAQQYRFELGPEALGRQTVENKIGSVIDIYEHHECSHDVPIAEPRMSEA